jgi:hypothetical protein
MRTDVGLLPTAEYAVHPVLSLQKIQLNPDGLRDLNRKAVT